ncbi:hypothetical protein BKA67DRAFT_535877 [Truncatella angustata]|uniref:Uncharacterized protein n=1 Tax=Truncatella angustata TaxID=152316 RepID=A0A9P8ZZ07_9PEZI|nr:uncharacterized protein BKA67DRAFT_535877 [Truncatella angustata]KAH6654561.1 hypothetical protein BKA67DRAFT_535877 [Truncatella angustata]
MTDSAGLHLLVDSSWHGATFLSSATKIDGDERSSLGWILDRDGNQQGGCKSVAQTGVTPFCRKRQNMVDALRGVAFEATERCPQWSSATDQTHSGYPIDPVTIEIWEVEPALIVQIASGHYFFQNFSQHLAQTQVIDRLVSPFGVDNAVKRALAPGGLVTPNPCTSISYPLGL